MRDIRDCILPLISTIIIFSEAHCLSCTTRVSNNNLRNNSYGNFFSVSNEISPMLVTSILSKGWQNAPKNEKEKEKKKIVKLFVFHANANVINKITKQ